VVTLPQSRGGDVSDLSILDPVVRKAVELHDLVVDTLVCDPDLADTAAFCAHYGFAMEQAANTILVASRKLEPPRYAVCVALGTTRLDVNRRVAELIGTKKLSFADADTTRAVTGMMIGGVVAVGIEDQPIYIDAAVMVQDRVVLGGGNRSSKLLLAPAELLKLPGATVVEGLANPST
jgi:prolyl-tRNA editing enzyme YbaK/EbsC (Cys-tRNA(Pro) deacylase)